MPKIPYFTDFSAHIWYNISAWKCIDFCEKPCTSEISNIIQKQYDYSDRELVEQIRENPYYQFFIGLPGYQDKAPYAPSLLVEFRKRLTDDVLSEINEIIARYNTPDDPSVGGSGDGSNDLSDSYRGTLILDATCAPQQICLFSVML